MTTERMSRNVMSLEQAMQRERAHKAKIERLKLQSQSRYDAEEPPLEIKGGKPLNLPDVGMKRKAPYSNPTPIYQPLASQRLREETTIREVIDDTVKRNIMPVELAMRRELANQRKLNSVPFQSLSHNDSKETPVPFQRSMTRVQFQPHNDSKETPVFVPGSSSIKAGETIEVKLMTTNERRMMMMRSNNNVMSMELALQREKAYKLAKNNERLQLQLQTLYDDNEHEHEPPLQIEGPPSNLELVGKNQNASFENLSLSQVRTSEPTEGQMTNERITSNVMSVELAMQRELAYRAKIERLQLQPRYAEEPPLQIEGPASYLKLVGMNQKENLSHSQVRTSEPILFKREVACERFQEETTIREVTDDRVKRNIMPVELAIQRELANQRKMESVRFQPHIESKETPVPFQRSMNRVQFQPHNHSKETPVSLQGAPSKSTNVGMKRIVPYGNHRYQPPQKMQSTHRQQGLGIQSQLPVNLYCKFCHLFCAGPSNYKQHCRGRKHKATLQQMNGQRNGGGAWPFWCDVCMIPCMNEDSFQMHLAGKKHALQATKNARIV